MGEEHAEVHKAKDYAAKYLAKGHRIINHPFYNFMLNIQRKDPLALVKFLSDPRTEELMEMSVEEQEADLGHDVVDFLCRDPTTHILLEVWGTRGGR